MKPFFLLLIICSFSLYSQDITTLREKPDTFVREYFENIKSSPYGESYSLVSENYRNYTGSIREYIKWWDSMEMVKVHEVSILDSNINQLTPRVKTILGYYFDGKTYYEEIIFVLGYNTKLNSWQFLDREKIERF